MFVLEDEIDEDPKLFVAPLPTPGLDLLPTVSYIGLLLFYLSEDDDGVVGGESDEKIGQVIDPTQILALDLSSYLEVFIGQQLQLRVLLQILLPFVCKLKHFHQFPKNYGPYLLIPHQPIKIDIEYIAINRVFLNLVGL